jgi:methionyl-tRNA formyltransferase|tara:strand:- start:1246 stop:1932 length:687 start_codon:yes stop_codon:yes gene_type:complete
MDPKIIFLCKKNRFCEYAITLLETAFNKNELIIKRGDSDEKLDTGLSQYRPDYLISFLSPWIIPETMLKKAKKAAINFHPASNEYPGTGCYNFALYNNAEYYGAVCHHMEKKVDVGKIINYTKFKIYRNETVETLKLRTMGHLLFLFQEILDMIYENKTLPESNIQWTVKPYTRKQLRELCLIEPSMSEEEIKRRIRATVYPSAPDGPVVKINDYEFKYEGQKRDPIV